jgi:glycosyltransferase involved in cell wall biosynthesis
VRVAYVLPNAHLGGAERVTLDLITLHDRAAFEPVAIFLRDGPLVEAARSLGVETHFVQAPRLRRVIEARRTRRHLAELLGRLRIDLVHSVMAWGHVYGGGGARRSRLPAVWFQHNVTSRRALDILAALTPARRILANSKFTAAAQTGLNPRRIPIELVYPGTRLPEEPKGVRRARGRRALDFDERHFLVGMAARLMRGKGQPTLLRAAASLCRARPDARVVMAGDALFGVDADYPGELLRLAADLGIADRVRFIGMSIPALDVLSALDVAIHMAEVPDAFGLGTIEAWAAGAALVAGDAWAVREIVSPGQDAILVPPGDHERLATALLTLHDDPDRQMTLAAAGEATVRSRFDAVAMTRRVEEIYRAVLAR